MDKKYARAYTEVLEILKHIPEDEYNVIPKTEIQFYENNCDKNYKYEYNESLELKDQTISREANAVIVSIYMNYFANDRQKSIINQILKQNEIKAEEEKREKNNPDNIFKSEKSENLPIEINQEKENFFRRIINKLKNIFSSKEKETK